MTDVRKLTVALGQFKVNQGDTTRNLEKMLSMIEKAADTGADIICFPELAYTGYFLTSYELQSLAEPIDGYFFEKISEHAREKRIHVIAGYAESVNIPGKMYNSCLFVDDEGNLIGNMRKVNAWGQEKLKFAEGDKFPVIKTKFGNVGIQICYDVEFPEPSRIQALKGAEIVFVSAVWSIPAERRWHVDLAGNALFNLMYVVGSNTVGNNCCGSSMIVGPDGEVRALASRTEEELLIHTIDLNEVLEVRSRIPYFNDFKKDTFSMDSLKNY
jgi:predicted amidohydrolase